MAPAKPDRCLYLVHVNGKEPTQSHSTRIYLKDPKIMPNTSPHVGPGRLMNAVPEYPSLQRLASPACMCARMCVLVYMSGCAHACQCGNARACACQFVCKCVCVCVCVCVCQVSVHVVNVYMV